ncbi:MAG: hypothetical protein R2853_09305 [Thermomicrobiales bacterium]
MSTPLQPDAAGVWIVEARQEPDQGRFAAARPAQHAEHTPLCQVERDPAQHGNAWFVAEPDVVQVNGERPGWQGLAGAIGDAGTFGQQRFDAAQAGAGLLQILHFVANLLGRVAQHLRVAEDEEDRPDGQRRVAVEQGAEPEGEGHAQPKKSVAGGHHAVAAHVGPQIGAQPVPHQLGAAVQHVVRAPLVWISSNPARYSPRNP